jgi:hypothetical protein
MSLARESMLPAESAGAPVWRFADLAFLGRNSPWRYGVSLALVVAIGLALSGLLISLFDALGFDVGLLSARARQGPSSLFDQALVFMLIFMSVIAFLPGLLVIPPFVHWRPRLSFLTGHARFAWGRLWISFGVAIAIFLSNLFFFLSRAGEAPVLHVEPLRYLVFVILALTLVPAQVFTEELFFRGYLTQAVGRLTGSLILRLLVPAALFVALHLANPEVSHNAPAALAGYALVALYLGALVLRGNGLEEAIGFHLANNFFALLVVGSAVSTAPNAAPFMVEPDLKTVLVVEPILYGCHYILVFSLLGRLGLPREDGA